MVNLRARAAVAPAVTTRRKRKSRDSPVVDPSPLVVDPLPPGRKVGAKLYKPFQRNFKSKDKEGEDVFTNMKVALELALKEKRCHVERATGRRVTLPYRSKKNNDEPELDDFVKGAQDVNNLKAKLKRKDFTKLNSIFTNMRKVSKFALSGSVKKVRETNKKQAAQIAATHQHVDLPKPPSESDEGANLPESEGEKPPEIEGASLKGTTQVKYPIELLMLAIVWGKKGKKDFFLDCLHIVDVLCRAFTMTFLEFLGLRWIRARKIPGTNEVYVAYERSDECIKEHLGAVYEEIKREQPGSVEESQVYNISTMVSHLYLTLSNPDFMMAYNHDAHRWVLNVPSPCGYIFKINYMTKAVHCGLMVVEFLFMNQPWRERLIPCARDFMVRLYRGCKGGAAFWGGLFYFTMMYKDYETAKDDSKIDEYINDPSKALDDVKIRADQVLPLDEKAECVQELHVVLENKSQVKQLLVLGQKIPYKVEWLVVRYMIAREYCHFQEAKVAQKNGESRRDGRRCDQFETRAVSQLVDEYEASAECANDNEEETVEDIEEEDEADYVDKYGDDTVFWDDALKKRMQPPPAKRSKPSMGKGEGSGNSKKGSGNSKKGSGMSGEPMTSKKGVDKNSNDVNGQRKEPTKGNGEGNGMRKKDIPETSRNVASDKKSSGMEDPETREKDAGDSAALLGDNSEGNDGQEGNGASEDDDSTSLPEIRKNVTDSAALLADNSTGDDGQGNGASEDVDGEHTTALANDNTTLPGMSENNEESADAVSENAVIGGPGSHEMSDLVDQDASVGEVEGDCEPKVNDNTDGVDTAAFGVCGVFGAADAFVSSEEEDVAVGSDDNSPDGIPRDGIPTDCDNTDDGNNAETCEKSPGLLCENDDISAIGGDAGASLNKEDLKAKNDAAVVLGHPFDQVDGDGRSIAQMNIDADGDCFDIGAGIDVQYDQAGDLRENLREPIDEDASLLSGLEVEEHCSKDRLACCFCQQVGNTPNQKLESKEESLYRLLRDKQASMVALLEETVMMQRDLDAMDKEEPRYYPTIEENFCDGKMNLDLERDPVLKDVRLCDQWTNTEKSYNVGYPKGGFGFKVGGYKPSKMKPFASYVGKTKEEVLIQFKKLTWARNEDIFPFNSTLTVRQQNKRLLLRVGPGEAYIARDLGVLKHSFDTIRPITDMFLYSADVCHPNEKQILREGFACMRMNNSQFRKQFDFTADLSRIVTAVLLSDSAADVTRDGVNTPGMSYRVDFGIGSRDYEEKPGDGNPAAPSKTLAGMKWMRNFEKNFGLSESVELRKDLGKLFDALQRSMDYLRSRDGPNWKHLIFSNTRRYDEFASHLRAWLFAKHLRNEWCTIQLKCLHRGDQTKEHIDISNCPIPGYNVTGCLNFIFWDSCGNLWSVKFLANSRMIVGNFLLPRFPKVYTQLKRQLTAIDNEYAHFANIRYNGPCRTLHLPPLSALRFRVFHLDDFCPWETLDIAHDCKLTKPDGTTYPAPAVEVQQFKLISAIQRDLYLSLPLSALNKLREDHGLEERELIRMLVLASFQVSYLRTNYYLMEKKPMIYQRYYDGMVESFGKFFGGPTVRSSATGCDVGDVFVHGERAEANMDLVVTEVDRYLEWINGCTLEEDIEVDSSRTVVTMTDIRNRMGEMVAKFQDFTKSSQLQQDRLQINEFRCLQLIQMCVLIGYGVEPHPILTKIIFLAKSTGGDKIMRQYVKGPVSTETMKYRMDILAVACLLNKADRGNAMDSILCESGEHRRECNVVDVFMKEEDLFTIDCFGRPCIKRYNKIEWEFLKDEHSKLYGEPEPVF